MAEVFRVFAYDINTNTKLTEIPAIDLTFSRRLGDAGAISFSVALEDPQVQQVMAPVLAYDGQPVACYVDRNGQLVWGGLIWTGNYSKATGVLEFGGNEFFSYFDQRVIAQDYGAGTMIDPAAFIALVIADAQAAGAGASIGVTVAGGSSLLPQITEGYPLAQYTAVSQVVDDMLALIVPGIGGLDLTQGVAWDTNGNPTRTFTIWSPRAGRAAGQTGLIFDLDSSIDYSWPSDAKQAGNTIIATGAGSGTAMPTQIVKAPGVPVGGLGNAPWLDKVVSFQSAQSQSQIIAAATGAAQQFGQPLRTPSVTVPTGGGQPLGSWLMGDDARLYSHGDQRFPTGKDEYWRIVQDSVTVPNEGLAVVELTFNTPPVF